MSIQIINPLSDGRWYDLVARHPQASAFHQRGWLEALVRTYGYQPSVLTSARPGEPLNDGIVLCRVSSWMTGTRLVSLPFADHCEPLLDDPSKSQEFMDWLRAECDRQRWRYVELRPLLGIPDEGDGLQPSGSYWFHELDIRPTLDQIFLQTHKNSFRRKIRRAEKERLSYEAGRSEKLLDEFYGLLLITRSRHHLPAQPRAWFKNLMVCMGDNIQIMVARQSHTPVAAMITLRHRSCVVYKYGCSDANFHNLGGMPYLFWKLVEESKTVGAEKIDFGRTDLDNEGLVVFKDRFGTKRELLKYYRYTDKRRKHVPAKWGAQRLRGLLSILPDAVLSTAGRLLYKHLG